MTCSVCLSGRHIGCRGCDCRVCVSPNGDTPARVTERRHPKTCRKRTLVLLPSPEINPVDQQLTGKEWKWALSPAQIRTSQIMKQTGATWEEIAQVFGLSRGTVHHTLSRTGPQQDFAVWYAKSLPLAVPA